MKTNILETTKVKNNACPRCKDTKIVIEQYKLEGTMFPLTIGICPCGWRKSFIEPNGIEALMKYWSREGGVANAY